LLSRSHHTHRVRMIIDGANTRDIRRDVRRPAPAAAGTERGQAQKHSRQQGSPVIMQAQVGADPV
jgi:hypothetical protein